MNALKPNPENDWDFVIYAALFCMCIVLLFVAPGCGPSLHAKRMEMIATSRPCGAATPDGFTIMAHDTANCVDPEFITLEYRRIHYRLGYDPQKDSLTNVTPTIVVFSNMRLPCSGPNPVGCHATNPNAARPDMLFIRQDAEELLMTTTGKFTFGPRYIWPKIWAHEACHAIVLRRGLDPGHQHRWVRGFDGWQWKRTHKDKYLYEGICEAIGGLEPRLPDKLEVWMHDERKWFR